MSSLVALQVNKAKSWRTSDAREMAGWELWKSYIAWHGIECLGIVSSLWTREILLPASNTASASIST